MMTPDTRHASSALFWLDAGCPRDEWVRIGMAAKSAGVAEPDWLEWCATGANYAGERDAQTVWRSFKPDGGIGEGTLFKLAAEQGWRDPDKANGHGPVHFALPRPPAANGAARPASKAPTGREKKQPGEDVQALWDSYAPAPESHGYIRAKGGVAEGLRMVPDDAAQSISGLRVTGWLAVPYRSIADGTLRTVQFVSSSEAQRRKLNLPGAPFADSAFITGSVASDGRLYVCEGIGQAWACVRADPNAAGVVTAGVGRFMAVAEALHARWPDARIVLMPDRGKEAEAEKVAREVHGAWVPMPDEAPPNFDAGDYAAMHGDEVLADLLAKPRYPEMRFRVLAARDLLKAPPLRWLVDGVLPREGLATLYGAPGSGKSFLALDLCAAVAQGRDEWFGYRLTGAPVTYCALEGRAGMAQRLQAWQEHHGAEVPEGLRFVAQELDLRTDAPDLGAAIVSAGGAAGLVVIDTLARSMGAFDENAAPDMATLVAACGELQRLTGGAVLLVHHSGKDASRGERGHSALRGALDMSLEVMREGAVHRWRVVKSKDGVDGSEAHFDLREVVFGVDDFGCELSSCVVVPANASAAPPRPKLPTGANQKIALDVLGELLREAGERRPADAPESLPFHRPVVEYAVAEAAVAGRIAADTKHRVQRAREAMNGLQASGHIRIECGYVWRV